MVTCTVPFKSKKLAGTKGRPRLKIFEFWSMSVQRCPRGPCTVRDVAGFVTFDA